MSTLSTCNETLLTKEKWDSIFRPEPPPRLGPKTESDNCNYALCAECGGWCCKHGGCDFSPQDFKELTPEGLIKEIKKGYITLEVYDGDPYYIEGFIWVPRMRNKGGPIIEDKIGRRKVNGACIALKEHGCTFNYVNRPTGGKLLIPGKQNGKIVCESKYDKRRALRDWTPHQHLIYEVKELIGAKDFPCTI